MLRKIRHIVGDHDQPGVEHRRALAVLVQLVGTVPLGKTGATVLGLALMVLALGAGAMVVRSVKAGRR